MLTFTGTRGNKRWEEGNVDVEAKDKYHFNLLLQINL